MIKVKKQFLEVSHKGAGLHENNKEIGYTKTLKILNCI